jgi:hypothetical protein
MAAEVAQRQLRKSLVAGTRSSVRNPFVEENECLLLPLSGAETEDPVLAETLENVDAPLPFRRDACRLEKPVHLFAREPPRTNAAGSSSSCRERAAHWPGPKDQAISEGLLHRRFIRAPCAQPDGPEPATVVLGLDGTQVPHHVAGGRQGIAAGVPVEETLSCEIRWHHRPIPYRKRGPVRTYERARANLTSIAERDGVNYTEKHEEAHGEFEKRRRRSASPKLVS